MGLATEKFLELLATSAYDQTRKDGRKTVTYKDLATAVRNIDQFEFLDQVIPMQVNFGDA
jgi:histone H3/H4